MEGLAHNAHLYQQHLRDEHQHAISMEYIQYWCDISIVQDWWPGVSSSLEGLEKLKQHKGNLNPCDSWVMAIRTC